jgi:trimethylamine--corrinoid protein Co-methyltransferase
LPALAGANLIYGAGMLELGITFSYAQLLIDADIIRMMKKTVQGITVSPSTLAVEVIKSVGAGKNYLTQEHTLKRMKGEQSRARLIDRRMRDGWMKKGGKDMAQRAREEVLALLGKHKPLPLEPSVKATLREMVLTAERH